MASKPALTRKQIRQPQARKASSGRTWRTRTRPTCQEQPARYADMREAAEESAPAGRCVLDCEQDGAAVLAADADALQDPQHDEQDRRPDPMGSYPAARRSPPCRRP